MVPITLEGFAETSRSQVVLYLRTNCGFEKDEIVEATIGGRLQRVTQGTVDFYARRANAVQAISRRRTVTVTSASQIPMPIASFIAVASSSLGQKSIVENEELTSYDSQSKLSQEQLGELQRSTHFDKKELQQWYKGNFAPTRYASLNPINLL